MAARGYHQDYIARIRYENPLPPPPGTPKLLDIPIDGLAYYASPAFAARLARQQPLNIEADAELGMPIDLVGLPGVLDGDDTGKLLLLLRDNVGGGYLEHGSFMSDLMYPLASIEAPLEAANVHPKDRALLRPLNELGKPRFSTGGHSFLRRTEYISSEAKARNDAAKSTPKAKAAVPQRRKDDLVEDPIQIMRHIIKGFDLANPDDKYVGPDDADHLQGSEPTAAERDAWENPRHPTRPDLHLVDSFPILPDLDAMTDQGTYIVTKFSGNLAGTLDGHPEALDVALLQPVEKEGDEYDYDLYMPSDDVAHEVKAKAGDVSNLPLESDTDVPTYSYPRLRTFDLTRQTLSVENPYQDVGLAFCDPTAPSQHSKRELSKAAYYYPISMKLQLKPKRNQNLAQIGLQARSDNVQGKVERPDEIVLTLRQPSEQEVERRQMHKTELVANPDED